MTTCDDNDATMERWAPLSPPDEFDDADAEWMPACVLASRGGRGGRGGERDGDVLLRTLIVQLGSWSFFRRHDVGGSTHNNSY
jgi:hypothetical protein